MVEQPTSMIGNHQVGCNSWLLQLVVNTNLTIIYICYSGSHKMKGATLMLFTVAMRTRPVFYNAPDVL